MLGLKRVLPLLAVLLVPAGMAVAQSSWSDRLFDTTSHDFGNVARGAKLKKRFRTTNRLNRTVHIYDVRTSCRICSVADLAKRTLLPGESVELLVTMDTIGYTGDRSVSITVKFDRPYFGETRLTLRCYSRSDVVIDPGIVDFGVVKKGQKAEVKVRIEYAGDASWRISDAMCTNQHVRVDLKEVRRERSQLGPYFEVEYQLIASLSPEIPAGSIFDRIVLTVNDPFNKTLELVVQGTVQADFSLSSTRLDFGKVPQGAAAKKQLIVRGVRPFAIKEVKTAGGPFHVKVSHEVRRIHFLEVSLEPTEKLGKVEQRIELILDVPGEPPLTLTACAEVVP
jgi:hypothetical protein